MENMGTDTTNSPYDNIIGSSSSKTMEWISHSKPSTPQKVSFCKETEAKAFLPTINQTEISQKRMTTKPKRKDPPVVVAAAAAAVLSNTTTQTRSLSLKQTKSTTPPSKNLDTATKDEDVTESSYTPSWTQIVQAAQSQEVANHFSDNDDDNDDDVEESTHDYFYSARDHVSPHHCHDRTMHTTATYRDNDADDFIMKDMKPIRCDQTNEDDDDDDNDSLPEPSNIPPPARRRNSIAVATILLQQDSTESVSTSETSHRDDTDVNDDTDTKLLSNSKSNVSSTTLEPHNSVGESKKAAQQPTKNAKKKDGTMGNVTTCDRGPGSLNRSDDTEPRHLSVLPMTSTTTPTTTSILFRIGDIVQVQPRTGPGMNRLGGIAEITQIHTSSPLPEATRNNNDHIVGTTTVSYDVRYVLNRRQREQNLEACYISEAPDYNNVVSNELTSASIQSNSAALKKRCAQRRSCPNPIAVLPSPLRAALLADGCDVDGIATRKALAEYNNNKYFTTISNSKDKENFSIPNNVQPRRKTADAKDVISTANSKRKILVAKSVPTNSLQTTTKQPPTKRMKASHPNCKVTSDDNFDDLTALSNVAKCQLADAMYRDKIERAMQKGMIYISTSLLSIVEQEQLQQLCRMVLKNMKGMSFVGIIKSLFLLCRSNQM
jgi:hypothetical protein